MPSGTPGTLYSIVLLWACDLLTSNSIPYAAAWYRKTSLTFTDAIGAVRLQLWVGDITSHSPPHREPLSTPVGFQASGAEQKQAIVDAGLTI